MIEEIRLWQAVILFAIYEAKGQNRGWLPEGSTPEQNYRWAKSRDGKFVCDMACIDQKLVVKVMKKINDETILQLPARNRLRGRRDPTFPGNTEFSQKRLEKISI